LPTATDIPAIQSGRTPVYRLGYMPDPFVPPPWRIIRRRDPQIEAHHDDATAGGRFDDPAARQGIAEARRFRTIYCASERVAAIAESLEPFRSSAGDKRRSPELEDIVSQHPELRNAAGTVTPDWIAKRRVGATLLDARLRFVDLGESTALDYLNETLGAFARSLGFRRIDYGTVLSSNRLLTQRIAGHFYELLDPHTDEPLFAGISYISSLDLGWRCWAVFDQRARPEPMAVTPLAPEDPDLLHVVDRFKLRIGSRE